MTTCCKCGQRPAIIHLTIVVNGEPTTSDYCRECSPVPTVDLEKLAPRAGHRIDPDVLSNPMLSALTTVELEGLPFVRACIGLAASADRHHVSPMDILTVAPAAAKLVYGSEARIRLKQLGISSSATLGEFVFTLIAKGVLAKAESDRLEDFSGPSPFDEFLANRGD